MKKKVAIIGSGIAGLALAGLLQTNSNFEFVIYEKGETLNLDEGFGIQLSAYSVFILNKIGFNQLNKNEKYHPSKLDFYSINYNKICDLDLTAFNFENVEYTTLKRSILINFLKEKLFSNSIMFGKKINVGLSVLNIGSMSVLSKTAPNLPVRVLSGVRYLSSYKSWSNEILFSTLICLSEYAHNYLSQYYPQLVAKTSVQLIAHGTETFNNETPVSRTENSNDPQILKILYVSTYVDRLDFLNQNHQFCILLGKNNFDFL